MKKILTYFLMICTFFSLCGCSSKVNQDHVVDVFRALNKTLKVNSCNMKGSIEMKDEKMDYTFDIIQEGNLECAFDLDLSAGNNTLDDFLSFYIKDGKTYLNSQGTTSQSVVENIGVDPTKKIAVYNPFLDFKDSELASFFTSTKQEGNKYTLEMNGKKLATILDAFGTVSFSKATIEATIENEMLLDLKITIKGFQAMDDNSNDVDLVISNTLENVNAVKSINFPEDLENY